MFDYYSPVDYSPELALLASLSLFTLILLYAIVHNLISFRSVDKDIKLGKVEARYKPNKLCQLKYSKILFPFFYKKEEGINEEIYRPIIRSYFYCLLVVLSIVAHAIFDTFATLVISFVLAFVNVFALAIDVAISEHIENKKNKENTTES